MNTMNTMNTSVNKYSFSLDRSSKKFNCPGCGQRRFVRYKETETGEYLHESVGRCDREDHCGYHLKPKEYFAENNISRPRFPIINTHWKEIGNTKIAFLPFEIFERSVKQHERCDLFPFLEKLFRKDIAKQLSEQYFVGPSSKGYTAFWQVDISGRIRQCKVMSYRQDGHRDKDKVLREWIDKDGHLRQIKGAYHAGKDIMKNRQANLLPCFFGEYLLSFPENDNKPIALVESEKTAVIASAYYPEFVWLATGGKHGAKWTEAKVCKVFNKRKVILFPDLGAFDSWKGKGLLMATVAGCKVAVSDILEKEATEEDRANGLDLADYLLRQQDGSGLALTYLNYPVIFDYSDKRTI